MARTYWNVVVAMVAALGLGGGMSWLLFAQAPDGAPDRFVTLDVSNEKVRCKILRSWSLPDGARAYQVKSVDAGDMLTVVRQAATAGEKDAFVRIYKWRDAATSPVGAPVPPGHAAPPTTVASKPAPTAVAKAAKKNALSAANPVAKGATKKEIIVTVPEQSGAEVAGPAGIAASTPPAGKRAPATTRNESGFDNSVDQLGQAPWAKDDAAADLPGKITLASAAENDEARPASPEGPSEAPARPNLEPMFALPSSLKAQTTTEATAAPKAAPTRATPPAPELEAASAPKAQTVAVPPPLPLPTLPASELLPPRAFPALAESTIVPPPLPPMLPPTLPSADVKAAPLPSSSAPPALPTVPEIASPLPPKSDIAPVTAVSPPPPPPAAEHGAIMVPPYESVRRSIADRLLSATPPRPDVPAAPDVTNVASPPSSAAKDAVTKAPDVSSVGDDRSPRTIVLGPTVIVQSQAPPNAAPETVPVVDKVLESFPDTAPVVSRTANFDIRQMPSAPPAPAWPAPAEPIAPPFQDPSALVVPSPVASVAAPTWAPPPPMAAKETELHPASHLASSVGPAPIMVNPPDFAPRQPVAAANVSMPEASMPNVAHDGGFNRSRTSIASGQAAVVPSAPLPRYVPASDAGAVGHPIVMADAVPVVTTHDNVAGRPNSIVAMLSGARGGRTAAPQRTLTGSLFGSRGAPTASHVNVVSPDANSSRETIVPFHESSSQYSDPAVMRKAAAPPRATSIVGLVSRWRDERAAAQSAAMPEMAAEYPIVTSGDRNRFAIGSGPMVAARPTAPGGGPGDTIVEVADSGYAGPNAAPVVERKPVGQMNRSATIVGLMGVNPMAIPRSTYAYAPPYASGAAASFDRTRTTISADQVAAVRPAVRPSPIAEPIVLADEAPPVVQKRKASLLGGRPTTIAAITGVQPAVPGHAWVPESAKESRPHVDAPIMPPPIATASHLPATPIAASADAPGKLLPAGYDAPPQPSGTPLPQPSHSTYGKSVMKVPANSAMDRPPSAALTNSGDLAALTKLMQTAKDSPQPSQRELAIIALSSYDGRALPQLVSFLNHLAVNDPAAAVRAAAVNALTRMNVAPESVMHTLATLRGDADARVRQAVAEATNAYGLANR